jgi:uncharacterized membrane protein YphA (DoxX/SURF4 family)
MKRKLAIEILAFLFALLFLYSAFNKLADYQKFVVQTGQSPLLTGFGDTIPWMVITAEILIAGFLMLPRFRLYAFFAAFSLMTMFTAYIVAILKYSPYVPCSCNAALEKLSWSEHLIFNWVFVVLGLAGIVLQAKESRAAKTENVPLTQISPA